MKYRLTQLLIVALPIVLFGWLMVQELVPSGTFEVAHPIGEPSPFIDRILPDQRVLDIQRDESGDTVRPIIGDPAFFFVHPHRGFETIDVEVWFKNRGAPLLELGGLAQTDGEVYDLKPLQNTRIDQLEWERVRRGDTVLLQRTPAYDSVEAFVENPPPRHRIATYHYTLSEPYRISNYRPRSTVQTIDVSLRGLHEFKTYIKNEPLNATFHYMDMNRDPGADPVEIAVFSETGEHVAGTRVSDDGNRTDDAHATGMRQVRIHADSLPEGVYKVVMKAGRDIFFRTIETTQQKIVFLNNVYLGDRVGYDDTPDPVAFWTEAKHLGFQTTHANGVQTVDVGGGAVEIDEAFKYVPHTVAADGVVRVTVPNADVQIQTDGHIALHPNQFFNPDPVRMRYNTDLDALDIDYVIANYTPPRTEGNWSVANATFDTDALVMDEETWKFVFSTPGIYEQDGRVDIGRIDMMWKRPPLAVSEIWPALKREFLP